MAGGGRRAERAVAKATPEQPGQGNLSTYKPPLAEEAASRKWQCPKNPACEEEETCCVGLWASQGGR